MKEWLISLTSVIIATSVAEVLLPSGKIRNVCKTVLSLVCLLVLISPLASLNDGELSIAEIKDKAEQSELFRENLNNYYDKITEQLVENCLSDKGIKGIATAEGELDKQNNYSIKKIIVKISGEVLSDKDGHIIDIVEITEFLSERLNVSESRVIVYVE